MLGGVTAAPEAAMVALSTLRLRVGGPPSPPLPSSNEARLAGFADFPLTNQ